MKFLTTLIVAGFLAAGTAYAAEEKKAPEVKTVCIDVQGRDGKAVIDPKTKKPKQNCTKVKVRQKHEGTKIPEGTKK
jgi:hypothetical protein